MGARSSRKRTGECLNNSPPMVNCHSEHQYHSDARISKRRRLSPMSSNHDLKSSSLDFASRLYRYPPISLLSRIVHAPCRNPKHRWSVVNNQHSRVDGERNGSAGRNVESTYEIAKSHFLWLFSTEKSKKKLDANHDFREDIVTSDDSDADIIEKIEDESVISEQRLQEMTLDLKSKTEEDGVALASITVVSDISRPVPLYKKLHQSASKSDSRISRLEFDIALEKLKSRSWISPLKKQAEEDVCSVHLKESFVPLTPEEDNMVANALSNANRRNILVTHDDSNIEITGEKLQCLRQGAWLNDEVINVYFELLKERERRDPEKFLQCHFFNSFFYKRLAGGRNGYDYKSVRRWTSQKKLGYTLIECDKIFVPVHKEVHWCLAVINNKDKKFQYLDSLGGRDSQVMRVLASYIKDEVMDKSGQKIDVSSWEREFVDDRPMQENGSDCGVFMIKYADFYSRNLGLRFCQENMPYFRRRIVNELLQLRAD